MTILWKGKFFKDNCKITCCKVWAYVNMTLTLQLFFVFFSLNDSLFQ